MPISPAPPTDEGYTLLELLVVMLVIALAAAFGAAMVPERGDAVELARMADKAAHLAALARNRAMTSGEAVDLRLASDGVLVAGSSGDRLTLGATPGRLTAAQSSRTVQSIRFYPDGSSSGGLIILGDNGSRSVIIEPITGRITVR